MLVNQKIRVLIVDDSVFVRSALKKLMAGQGDIEIVGEARNGQDGLAKLREFKPDVVVLDVEMPIINGLQALRLIMDEQPTPVIIFSSSTSEGAKSTLQAFELGAVDVIAKPSDEGGGDLLRVFEEMVRKIKTAATVDVSKIKKDPADKGIAAKGLPGGGLKSGVHLVAIGISTGGPQALEIVVKGLPADLPVPVVVAQHMPEGFTELLAKRLDSKSAVTVKEAEDGERLLKQTVYIAKSGRQMEVVMREASFVARIFENHRETYKPSVDVLFKSLARLPSASSILGVIMTGMGVDGLQGAKELKAKGAGIIAESEKTCVVYGMPRAVIEAGLADRIDEASAIASSIMQCIGRR